MSLSLSLLSLLSSLWLPLMECGRWTVVGRRVSVVGRMLGTNVSGGERLKPQHCDTIVICHIICIIYECDVKTKKKYYLKGEGHCDILIVPIETTPEGIWGVHGWYLWNIFAKTPKKKVLNVQCIPQKQNHGNKINYCEYRIWYNI